MTQKQRSIYGEYVLNERTRMEKEIEQLQQNIRFRDVSQLDCLELIIAKERYNSFCEFVRHINAIMQVERYDLKVNLQKNRKGRV